MRSRPPFGRGPFGHEAFGRNVWARRMLVSYKAIHGTLSSAVEDALITRLAPGGYLYTTFGPDGQNKQVCDFLLAFQHTNDLVGRVNAKTGDALRWDAPGATGSPFTQDDLPTTDAGAGVITVSSTDGWSGVTEWLMFSNLFTGPFPNLFAAGFTAITRLRIETTGFTADLALFALLTTLNIFNVNNTSISGDGADLSPLVNLTSTRLQSSSISEVSGVFYNAGLISCLMQDLGFSIASVDQVLVDLAALIDSFVAATQITLNIGGTNGIPSAAGDAAIVTINAGPQPGGWTGGAPVLTVSS